MRGRGGGVLVSDGRRMLVEEEKLEREDFGARPHGSVVRAPLDISVVVQ